MKLSLSNGVFSQRKLYQNLAVVRELGFENIEFNMRSVETENDLSIYTAKRLVEENGLNCLTLHAATLHVRDEVEVHRAVYYGKISLEFAYALSAPTMVVHSNVVRNLPPPQRRKCLARIFGEIKPYADSLGVKLALENLSYASSGYGKNVAEIEEILEIIDASGTMGFTLDFCHAIATGTTWSLLEKYNGRLCNVHVSNRGHKPFDDQTAELAALLSKLNEYSYQGPISVELSRKCTLAEILKTKNVIGKALDRFVQPKC